jgi:hypothetical protein
MPANDDRRDRRQNDQHLYGRLAKVESLLHTVNSKVDNVTAYAKEAKSAAAAAAHQSELINSRVERHEQDLVRLHQRHETDLGRLNQIVHGDPTDLSDSGGIVGTLRSTNLIVRITLAIITLFVVPGMLTLLGIYLNRLL